MISARRKAELADELQRELDTVDRLEVQAKEDATDRRKEILLHRQKVRQLRDLLAGREVAQSSLPGTEVGEVKPRPAAPKKAEPTPARRADRYDAIGRPKGELTRWIADARARKVPTFVIEQTGIRTKAGIIAKWGDNAVFEKGKPCPRDRDGLQSWERKPAKVRPVAKEKVQAPKAGTKIQWTPGHLNQEGLTTYAAKFGGMRYELQELANGKFDLSGRRGSERSPSMMSTGLASPLQAARVIAGPDATVDEGALLPRLTADDVKDELCLDCGIAAGKPSPGCEGCDHPDESKGKKGRPKGAPQDDCTRCGAPSYALVDGEPTCHPCYEKVARKTEPLDALVGTREDAVKRHAAGKAVGT